MKKYYRYIHPNDNRVWYYCVYTDEYNNSSLNAVVIDDISGEVLVWTQNDFIIEQMQAPEITLDAYLKGLGVI